MKKVVALPEIRLDMGWPKWITTEMITDTIQTWQPYSQTVLTAEDAVQMLVQVRRLNEALSSSRHRRSAAA
jgi:hypothetical protein